MMPGKEEDEKKPAKGEGDAEDDTKMQAGKKIEKPSDKAKRLLEEEEVPETGKPVGEPEGEPQTQA